MSIFSPEGSQVLLSLIRLSLSTRQTLSRYVMPSYFIFTGYSYVWFLNGDPSEYVTSDYNNHIFESTGGTLYFSAVFKSDAALYACAVSVEGGEETRNSPNYDLRVDTSSSEFTIVCSILFCKGHSVVFTQSCNVCWPSHVSNRH